MGVHHGATDLRAETGIVSTASQIAGDRREPDEGCADAVHITVVERRE